MSCSHLEKFKSYYGLENYDTIYSSFVLPSIWPDPAYHKASLSCFECEHYNNTRLLACMHCIYFGCYDKHCSQHTSSKAHDLFVELSSGNILCGICKNFMYDREVDEIIKKYEKINNNEHHIKWKPTENECKLFKEHTKRVKLEPKSSIGMRGMVNLGNTCYMNCIIQALLHTPMLRDYYFTDKHKCHAKKSKECLFCLFASFYQRYYADDDPAILSLPNFIYIVWQNNQELIGSEQKDVHEFFISARNLLHDDSSTPSNFEESCNCIIESIFHGYLQSDIVCQNCSNVSTKIDPLWEIVLDIPEPPSKVGLLEFLYHYTRPEPLCSNYTVNCGCNSRRAVTKQSTFKLLPPIIVIQLNRFHGTIINDNYIKKKICLFVPFPVNLDMSPFLTGKRNEKENNCQSSSSTSVRYNDHEDYRYSLYAVIVHVGTDIDKGHYISYIRRTKNEWFKCNDLLVVPVKIEEVLASEGYLLFYHKTVLPYE